MDNRRFVANMLEVSPNSLKELPDYAIAKIVELHGKASGDVLPAGWEVSHPLLSLEKFNGLPATRGPLVGTRFIYDLTAPIPCSMFKLLTPVEIANVGGRAVTVARRRKPTKFRGRVCALCLPFNARCLCSPNSANKRKSVMRRSCANRLRKAVNVR